MRSSPSLHLLPAVLLGCIAAFVFWGAFAAGASGRSIDAFLDGWRGWDDLAIATVYLRDDAIPVAPYGIGNSYRRTSPEFKAFRRPIMKALRDRPVSDIGVVVDVGEATGERAFPVRRIDDSGRAFFLALLFRLTGAARPLLVVWLPLILIGFALAWLTVELARAGRILASLVTPGLVAWSAFFREASALGYAAYGFYVAAGVALVAFSVGMNLRSAREPSWFRLALAATVLMIATPARNAAWLMAPGFLAAWMFGTWTGSRVRAAGLALAGAFSFFVLPQVAILAIDAYSARTLAAAGRADWRLVAGGHDTWPTLWIGLGDFDREKGHVYLDEAAKGVALAGGLKSRLDPAAEGFFRGIILDEIAADPLWFLEILAKRAVTTFFLPKLTPFADESGQSYAPAVHPNEGAFDSYISLSPTVDRVGWGRGSLELPVWLLWLGWPVLALARVGSRGQGDRRALPATLLAILMGLMATPVIVTTASGIEMQVIGLAHFLVWGLALDELTRRLRNWKDRVATTASRPAV